MSRCLTMILAAAFFAFLTTPSSTAEASETAEAEDVQILEHDALIIGHESSWFLFGGVGGGGSFHSAGTGGFAGAELSTFRLKHSRWFGAYADGQYDFQSRAFAASLGPKLGYKFLGLGSGLSAQFGEGGPIFGPHASLMLTVGVLTISGRYSYFPEFEEQVVQVGMTIKLPLIAPWGYEIF